jgi:predicted DNA-binding WGR domain protein
MLGWHYRSRSESLISFSNHAFYDARLLTIPDRQLERAARNEIVVKAASEAADNVDALLARSVSFHFHPEAVYERRSNTAEADCIAHLLRELLARDTKLSLGVVAFSEAQQSEIESALTRLGAEDAAFRNRLEAEYEREDEGQFCGLFVKNLENVQGDERDIILLSVCYGYDRGRRMLMNFGPINQRGGEKRLNVIFSRARMHMAVISSIRHFDIKNEYNDGANCLRHFLEYAAACSIGDAVTARRVLQSSNGLLGTPSPRDEGRRDTVTTQLADALRVRGLLVETQVGQSTFRLPLAVRRPNETAHALGILIDDAAHYAQKDLLERYLLRPGVLHAFGWQVITVFTKDWYQDPDAVCRRIEDALSGVAPPVVEEPAVETKREATAVSGGCSAAKEPARERALSKAASANAAPQFHVQEEVVAAAAVVATPPVRPEKVGRDVTATPAAAEKSSGTGTPDAVRRFTCQEGGASKFWEAAVNGNELTVRFGRIGTRGQAQTNTFATRDAARREQEKLMRSKIAKGYAEGGAA